MDVRRQRLRFGPLASALALAASSANCIDIERSGGAAADVVVDAPAEDEGGDGGPSCTLDEECVGTVAVNACQRVDCQNQRCTSVAANDGASCTSDSSLCITGTCSDGSCTGLADVDCGHLDQGRCQSGACDQATGQCVATHAALGTTCADSLCTIATCDGEGACGIDGYAAGAACSTGTPCLIDGSCTESGVCQESWDAESCACTDDSECDDQLDCTLNRCIGGSCQFEPFAVNCAINGSCYFVDTVSPSDPCRACRPSITQWGWSGIDCDDQDPCTVDTCSPTGGCQQDPAAADGAPCADGPACASEALGTCQDGSCLGCEFMCVLSTDCESAVDAPPKGPCETYKCEEGQCLVLLNDELQGTPCEPDDPCVVDGVCVSGLCQGTPYECASQACKVATCTGVAGQPECTYDNLSPGSPCDDGDACTLADSCDGGGTCAGSALDCSALSVGQCVAGLCVQGECQLSHLVDGTSCDLPNLCGTSDSCQDGVCTAAAACPCQNNAECDDGLSCTFDLCDGGACAHQVVQNTCLIDGVCVERDAVHPDNLCLVCGDNQKGWDLVACDDDNPCTDDTCASDEGCDAVVNPQNPCNDGDPCSADDHCDASGACVGTCACDTDAGITCEGTPPPCMKWTCESFSCVATPDDTLNGSGCDDGKFCVAGETCQDGVCQGSPRDCAAVGDAMCKVGTCDEGANACVAVDEAPGAACDDADPCTVGDACDDAGVCGGAPKDCSGATSPPCMVGACAAGACIAQPQPGLACADDEPCTLAETCDAAGACVGTWDTGEPSCGCSLDSHCSGLATLCLDGLCDATTGTCYTEPKPEPPPCDDGNACTLDDKCQADGSCAGTIYTCDDGVSCTDDPCGEGEGECSHVVLPGFCLIADTCHSDGSVNPEDACQRCVAGSATDVWQPNSGGSCDDGDGCTDADVCDSAGSCAGTPYSCADDGLTCTDAVCGPGEGECTQVIADNTCLIDDECYGAGESSPTNSCLTCNPSANPTGWTASGGDCDDGEPCTKADSCSAGECKGEAYTCSDAYSCTDDVCDGLGGCSFNVQPSACLIAGTCYSDATQNPTNECQHCDVSQSHSAWSGTPIKDCDDGLGCTTNEQCDGNGQCLSGVSICTPAWCEQSVCEATGCVVTLKPGHCKIDDTCYVDGDTHPSNPCQACLAAISSDDWTASPPGPCDDGQECTHTDRCSAGACVGTFYSCLGGASSCVTQACDGDGGCDSQIDAGTCLISETCYNDGDEHPENECKRCDAASSQTGWTAKSNGMGCSGPGCTINSCQGGVCDSSYHPPSGQCYIGGSCYAAGEQPWDNPCHYCDLGSPLTWNQQSDGTSCGLAGPCAGEVCLTGDCTFQAEPDFTACDDLLNTTTGDWCYQGSCAGFVREATSTHSVASVPDRYLRANRTMWNGVQEVYATYHTVSGCDWLIGPCTGDLVADHFVDSEQVDRAETIEAALDLPVQRHGVGEEFIGLTQTLYEATGGGWIPWSEHLADAGAPIQDVMSGTYATSWSGWQPAHHVFSLEWSSIVSCLSASGTYTCEPDENLNVMGASAGFVALQGAPHFFDTSGTNVRMFALSTTALGIDGLGWTLVGSTGSAGRTARAAGDDGGETFVVVGDGGLILAGDAPAATFLGNAGSVISVPGFDSQSFTQFSAVTSHNGHFFVVGTSTTSSGSGETRTIWIAHAPSTGAQANASWSVRALDGASSSLSGWLDDIVGAGIVGVSSGLWVFGGWRSSPFGSSQRASWFFEF